MNDSLNGVQSFEEELGQRIELAAERVGGKKTLSREAGIPESGIYRYIKGESAIPAKALVKIAEVAGLSIQWLATGEGQVDASGNQVAQESELESEFALVPGYNIQVAAGAGAFPENEEPSRKLAFRHKWLKYRNLKEADLVLVFAKGDSMEPTISDNNTLLIDTSKQDLTDGNIYVIRVNSHLVVKRVQTLLNRDIMLLSDNKEYHPETIKPDQLQDLQVIGKVVWIGKDV
ncbi:helix-turn-helix transcriptional regulator [Pontibacterium granulatum]|uniref:helix-turn-helix transcriptional regulator n=1 Tax=Pontibacterium granulatum TaxID=2036029 RepID=UPI00249BDD8B|nr:helix-turn-helix transcriptional regulator [Pontibacterium granulatum]MDI3325608.1 helix-turn-helix transcriptional regulator [Pontibacterium granulatum]